MKLKNIIWIVAFIGLAVSLNAAESINVNGANRSMIVYAPSNIEKNRPLIIQMHGMSQGADYQKNAAKWEPIADTARFVVVFPEGENKAWDISGDKDVNFLKAIINQMSTKYGINKNRVYVSGFSMGGMMSYHAANKMGDQIAAIAPVSGYPIGNPAPASKRVMPILHTHGTSDDVVNYNSAVTYLKRWVDYNKCSTNSKVTKPYPANKPGSAAYLEVWSGCNENTEIRLMSITGKGHWYSMDLASVNTSDEIWNFVKKYSLNGSIESTPTEPVTPAEPTIVVPTNRDSIFNSSFDSSAIAWNLQIHGDAKAEGSVTNDEYKLQISEIGNANYQVQLIQHDLHLENDNWYKVMFDARAESSRKLEVNVEQHTDPWDSYLNSLENFDISTETKSYSFTFKMNAPTDTNSRLSFNAGSATGTLYLDNIKLFKVENPQAFFSNIKFNATLSERYKVYGANGAFIGSFLYKGDNLNAAVRSYVKRTGSYIVKSDRGKSYKINVK